MRFNAQSCTDLEPWPVRCARIIAADNLHTGNVVLDDQGRRLIITEIYKDHSPHHLRHFKVIWFVQYRIDDQPEIRVSLFRYGRNNEKGMWDKICNGAYTVVS